MFNAVRPPFSVCFLFSWVLRNLVLYPPAWPGIHVVTVRLGEVIFPDFTSRVIRPWNFEQSGFRSLYKHSVKREFESRFKRFTQTLHKIQRCQLVFMQQECMKIDPVKFFSENYGYLLRKRAHELYIHISII